MQAVPASEALAHCSLEEIGRDAIVVAPVARLADALDKSLLLEEASVDAGASFARAQLIRDFIEGEIAFSGEQESDYSAGDPWESIALLGQGEPLDEVLSGATLVRRGLAAVWC